MTRIDVKITPLAFKIPSFAFNIPLRAFIGKKNALPILFCACCIPWPVFWIPNCGFNFLMRGFEIPYRAVKNRLPTSGSKSSDRHRDRSSFGALFANIWLYDRIKPIFRKPRRRRKHSCLYIFYIAFLFKTLFPTYRSRAILKLWALQNYLKLEKNKKIFTK